MSHVDCGDRELLESYNEVIDPKNATNWFLMVRGDGGGVVSRCRLILEKQMS